MSAGLNLSVNDAKWFTDNAGEVPAQIGDEVRRVVFPCGEAWHTPPGSRGLTLGRSADGRYYLGCSDEPYPDGSGFHLVSSVDASRPLLSEDVIAGLGEVIDI